MKNTMKIRYKKTNKSGILVSERKFYSKRTKSYYLVYIDENNLTFRIKNIKTERNIIKGGEGINNRAVLLRNAKKRLIQLGVEFDVEVRRILK